MMVVASWLFAQYLLTNEVQIGYAKTEGYVPVTSKAQESKEYMDYIARCGEDNDLYYDVKLKASALLAENVEHTFVTSVFNGSASLRNAAGQLIENTTKSVRRKEEINDAYFAKLYDDMNALYRLDQVNTEVAEKTDLGKLPKTAVTLLVTLAVAWILMGVYVAVEWFKKKK